MQPAPNHIADNDDVKIYSSTIAKLIGYKPGKNIPKNRRAYIEMTVQESNFIKRLMSSSTESTHYTGEATGQVCLGENTYLKESLWIELKEHRQIDNELDLLKNFRFEAMKAILAFGNSSGGILLYGVNDTSHRVTGCYMTDTRRDQLQITIADVVGRVSPELTPCEVFSNIWPLMRPEGDIGVEVCHRNARAIPYLIMVAVMSRPDPEDRQFHYLDVGLTFVRQGSTSRRYSRVDIERQFLMKEMPRAVPYLPNESTDAKFITSSKAIPTGGGREQGISNPMKLPIYEHVDEIKALVGIEEIKGFCIKGITGCGKSTQVPLILSSIVKEGVIIVAQPRRISCVKTAKTLSQQTKTTLGNYIGYKIGQSSVLTNSTPIIFVTYGILRMLLRDYIDKVSLCGEKSASVISRSQFIVFDELHERNIDIDICLALARYIMVIPEHPRFVFMSATLPTSSVPMQKVLSSFLPPDMKHIDGRTCKMLREITTQGEKLLHHSKTTGYYIPIIEITGLLHPIEYLYIDSDVVMRSVKNHPNRINRDQPDFSKFYWPGSARDGLSSGYGVRVLNEALEATLSLLRAIYNEEIRLPKFKSKAKRINDNGPEDNTNIIPGAKPMPKSRKGVLVFAPGISIIYELISFIEAVEDSNSKFDVHILHSTIPLDEMQLATAKKLHPPTSDPSNPNQLTPLKVYLATNIVESSVTINDISFVIDLCTRRIPVCERSKSGMGVSVSDERLEDVWASKDNLTQTAGRVGRVGPSCIFRMIPKNSYEYLLQSQLPEILRRSLLPVVLLLTGMHSVDLNKILSFLPDEPQDINIKDIIRELEYMGAIDHSGGRPELTDLGKVIVKFPLTPQATLFMLNMMMLGFADEGVILACIISRKTVIINTARRPELTIAASYKYALGCRSDPIASYNAYVYWLRNRVGMCSRASPLLDEDKQCLNDLDTLNGGVTIDPDCEKEWLNNHAWISLYNLRELDDLVLDCRARAYKCGFVSKPPHGWEMQRKAGNVESMIEDLTTGNNIDLEESDESESECSVLTDESKEEEEEEKEEEEVEPPMTGEQPNVEFSSEEGSDSSEYDVREEQVSHVLEFAKAMESYAAVQRDVASILEARKDTGAANTNNLDPEEFMELEPECEEVAHDYDPEAEVAEKVAKERKAMDDLLAMKEKEKGKRREEEEETEDDNDDDDDEITNEDTTHNDPSNPRDCRDWMDVFVNKPIDEPTYREVLSHINPDYIHMREDNNYKPHGSLGDYSIPTLRRPLPRKVLDEICTIESGSSALGRPRFIPPLKSFEKALLIEICFFLSHISSCWQVSYETPAILAHPNQGGFENPLFEANNMALDEPLGRYDIAAIQPNLLNMIPTKRGLAEKRIERGETDRVTLRNNTERVVRFHTNLKNKFECEFFQSVDVPQEYSAKYDYIFAVNKNYYIDSLDTSKTLANRFTEIEKQRVEKLTHKRIDRETTDNFNPESYSKVKIDKNSLYNMCYNLDPEVMSSNKVVYKKENMETGSVGLFIKPPLEKVEEARHMNPCSTFEVFPLGGFPIPIDILKMAHSGGTKITPLDSFATIPDEVTNKYAIANFIPSSKDISSSVPARDITLDNSAKLAFANLSTTLVNPRNAPFVCKQSLCFSVAPERKLLEEGYKQLETLLASWKRFPKTQQIIKLAKLPYELRTYLQLINREGVVVSCSNSPTRIRPLRKMLTMLPFGYPQMKSILLFLFSNHIKDTPMHESVPVPGSSPYVRYAFTYATYGVPESCALVLSKKELETLNRLRGYFATGRISYSKLGVELSSRDYRIQERHTKYMDVLHQLQQETGYRPLTASHDLLAALGFGYGVAGQNIYDPFTIRINTPSIVYNEIYTKKLNEMEEVRKQAAALERELRNIEKDKDYAKW